MEAAIENEAEIVPVAFGNERVAEIRAAELPSVPPGQAEAFPSCRTDFYRKYGPPPPPIGKRGFWRAQRRLCALFSVMPRVLSAS